MILLKNNWIMRHIVTRKQKGHAFVELPLSCIISWLVTFITVAVISLMARMRFEQRQLPNRPNRPFSRAWILRFIHFLFDSFITFTFVLIITYDFESFSFIYFICIFGIATTFRISRKYRHHLIFLVKTHSNIFQIKKM